ncbi:TetR/AcrR family transcriptional regulator [Pseudomonas frederiksbergensis]|uniref:TetR family transcriptional regulator n=1 Tax=Pseudomonas frederiksbergensis TaxID=104087 RepID=A0A423KFI6_9PSED|nr:TetR/AcrR family transcriptional regulator [Pseudomonas frederiksbergensis]RON51603.1 TetR family transcriptional regulator [Pseudomonas frederiksbergensis]
MKVSKRVRQHILDTAKVIVSLKGFSAVGLNEVLQAADVPKGSFYHYFGSKDAFGVALLDNYFESYLNEVQPIFQQPDTSERQKLIFYWQRWIDNQTQPTDAGKCLAVKLGAEVADLSEPMRLALDRGTSQIISVLAAALDRGMKDGSLTVDETPECMALRLYALWLGASVMAKITLTTVAFEEAMQMTRTLLGCVDEH